MVFFFGVLSNFGIKVFANFIKHSEKCYLVFCNKDFLQHLDDCILKVY